MLFRSVMVFNVDFIPVGKFNLFAVLPYATQFLFIFKVFFPYHLFCFVDVIVSYNLLIRPSVHVCICLCMCVMAGKEHKVAISSTESL